MSKNIEKQVKEVLAKYFSVDEENIKDDSLLFDDLGLDSYGALELLFALKEKIGLEIPQASLANIRTVKDVITQIESRTIKK